METVTVRKARRFALVWSLVTTAAYGVSGLLFHFPGAFPPNNGETFNAGGITGAIINGLGTGLLVGISQRYLMRRTSPGSWRWAACTVVALWVIHVVGDTFPDSLALPLMFVLGGLVLGCLQWWAVRWPPGYGLTWLAASAISWSSGLWLSRIFTTGTDWRTEHVVTGLLAGVFIGVMTAVAWLWMLLDQVSREEPSREIKTL
jgi:hypothetical protein